MNLLQKIKPHLKKLGLLTLGMSSLIPLGLSTTANAAGHNTLLPVNNITVGKNYLKLSTEENNLQTIDVNGATKQRVIVNSNTDTGWPHNSVTGVWNESYDKNKTIHAQNILGHLGSEVYKITIPKYKSSPEPSIKIRYKDAVKYDGQMYDATLIIDNIQRYTPNLWGISTGKTSTRTKPDIYVGKSFKDGIWYDGITRARATLAIDGLTWENGKHAYFTFNSLNGEASGTKAADKYDAFDNATQSFYNNAYFFAYASTSRDLWASFTTDSGKKKYVTQNDPHYDMTGKWVNWDNGRKGYVYDNTGIGTYWSKIQNGYVNGGLPDTHYSNDSSSSDYYTHSIMYQVDSGDDGNTNPSFTFGSGQGYGNFKFSTRTFKSPKQKEPEPEPKTRKIEKSTNKMMLSKQNDTYTYTISGSYPERTMEKDWYVKSTTYERIKEEGQAPYYIPHENWAWKPAHSDDYMDVTDNVPEQVSVQSVRGDNINVSNNGNKVTAHADYNDLVNHSKQNYKIYITVKADRLPQPDADGWHDDGPAKHGMYYIYNTAFTDQSVKGINHHYETQRVHVGIERWQGIIHHYDFDSNNGGDFKGFGINWQGDNFQNATNYANKDLATDYVYGYVNDTKPINSKYLGEDRNGGTYQPYVQNGTIKLVSPDVRSDGTTSDSHIPNNQMIDNFYMPYYATKLSTIDNMVKIDTDKSNNGLPIHIYQRNESFLYQNLDQYKNVVEHVNVYQVLNNGQKVSNSNFNANRNLSDMIASSQHGSYWWNIDGKLNNLVNPDTGNGNPNPGQKLNFRVEITYDRGNGQNINGHNVNIGILQSGTTMDTYGFISSDTEFNNANFNGKGYLALNPVERTIAYNGSNQIRELREGIRVDQQREANAKTGYGFRNDFQLSYAGWNNVNNLQVADIMNNATQLNFVFPKEFAENGLDHDSDSIKKDKDSGFKNSDSAINYNAYNNINPLNSDLDGSTTFLQDRLHQINKFADSDEYNPNMGNNNDAATLDTFDKANGADINAMNNARQIASDDPVNQFDETVSSFNSNYRFYDRIANFGANLPNGVVGLASNDDPEASNKVSFDSQNSDGGYRFYTPYWLSLKSSKSRDGKYPTYWERNTKNRFGANFFNINDRRPINFYGHMYLANNSKSDQNDELSIQPLITAKQIPNGFSQSQVDWLKHYATFK